MDLSNSSVITVWLRQALIPDCESSDYSPYYSNEPISLVSNSSLAVIRFSQPDSTSPLYEDEYGGRILIGSDVSNLTGEGSFPEWVPTYSNDAQVLVILVAYAISFLLSFGGNWLAIIVFVRFDYWPKDLRLLLTNICVAGLMSAVLCLPFTLLYQLLQSWVFTPPLCRIITFLQLAATIATILTHLAIGLNRLWVIVYPLRASTFQEYVWRIVGVIWLVASLISAPNLITTNTRPRRGVDGCYAGKLYLMCMEQWEPEYSAAYTWTLMICMYFLPMLVLLCIYGIAGYVLSKSNQLIETERSIAKRIETKRKVLRMLMLIFALFALSWMPLHTFFIFQSFREEVIMANFEIAERVYWVIHWMATSNSFQNPIVYCFFDEKFKVGVVNLFGGKSNTRPGTMATVRSGQSYPHSSSRNPTNSRFSANSPRTHRPGGTIPSAGHVDVPQTPSKPSRSQPVKDKNVEADALPTTPLLSTKKESPLKDNKMVEDRKTKTSPNNNSSANPSEPETGGSRFFVLTEYSVI